MPAASASSVSGSRRASRGSRASAAASLVSARASRPASVIVTRTARASGRNAFAEWRRREQAYAELSALDDRSLADIGLRRSEIDSVVAGTYQNELPREKRAAKPAGMARPHAA